MTKRTQAIIKYIVPVLVTAGAFFYIYSLDVDFEKMWFYVKKANYMWVLVSMPIILFSHWTRAVRWKTIIKPIVKPSSIWNLFKAVMVGYAANNIVPRGGELLRPWVFSKKENVPYSTSLATIVVERFIDVITLAILLIIGLIAFQEKIAKSLEGYFDPNNLIIPIIFVLLVLILSFYPPVFQFFMRIFIKPISKKFYDKLTEIFEKFQEGFSVIKEPKQYARIVFESFVMWFCYAAPMYVMFIAFGFDVNFGLGMDDAVLMIIIVGVIISIAPTPGGIGIYHVFVSEAMVLLYGINYEEAFAYAFVMHLLAWISQTFVGGAFYFMEDFSDRPEENSDLQTELPVKD